MRDFFKKEVLDRTYEIFGVRQTDEEKMSDDDIKFLLDGLCQVSKNYSYIPEEDQKNIIRACMLSDKTYRNINLRLVAGWLELNGKKWFTELAHKETVITAPPLEGEARDEAIQNYLNALAKVKLNFTGGEEVKGNGAKMREQLESAGIVHNPEPKEESSPETRPYFCLKTNVCKVQCERCRAEEEITNQTVCKEQAENKPND